MEILSKLFSREAPPPKQAVLVHVDAVGLLDAGEHDLCSLEDALEQVLSREALGSWDGNHVG